MLHGDTVFAFYLMFKGIVFAPAEDAMEDVYILEQIEALTKRHHKVCLRCSVQ